MSVNTRPKWEQIRNKPTVLTVAAQTFDNTQKAQARVNIDAARQQDLDDEISTLNGEIAGLNASKIDNAALQSALGSYAKLFDSSTNGVNTFLVAQNAGVCASFLFASEDVSSSLPLLTIEADASNGFLVGSGSFGSGIIVKPTHSALTFGSYQIQLSASGYTIADPAEFRSAIGAIASAGGTLTGPLMLSATTTGAAAGAIYRTADTLRYRDSTNTERLILNATDNLANLASSSTARTNLGLGTGDSPTFTGITASGTITAGGSILALGNRVMLAATNSSLFRVTDSAASVGFSLDCSTDGTMNLRNRANSAAGNLICGTLSVGTYTVATLPSASANAGRFAQVTDSNSTTNGGTVAGGGSNRVPVFSNGTNWIIK